MAPSATDGQSVTVEVPELNAAKGNVKPDVTSQEKWVKSTGALDQFESFDVTPVIGREFPNVNLVEWLKAPNSDELLRELALTSKFPIKPNDTTSLCRLMRIQYLSVVWYSSAHKMTSPPTYKKSSSSALVSFPESQLHQVSIYTQYSTQRERDIV